MFQTGSLQLAGFDESHLLPPRNSANFLVLATSLMSLGPLACLLAAVNDIRKTYDNATYMIMVGFLYMAALPVSMRLVRTGRMDDNKLSSRSTLTLRMSVALLLQFLSSLLLAFRHKVVLMGTAAIIGTTTWVAVYNLVSVCGLLPESAFVWQGLGYHGATLMGILIAALLKNLAHTAWLMVAALPVFAGAAWFALISDPAIVDRLQAKDQSCERRGVVTKVQIPDDAKLLSTALLLGVLDSVVVGGLVTYFNGHVGGSFVHLSTAIFFATKGASIIARPLTLLFDAAGWRPNAGSIMWRVCFRLALTPLVLVAAFSDNPPTAWVIAGIIVFSVSGGMMNTWAYVVACDVNSHDPDLKVETSRVLLMHQNVGLSLGAGVSALLAVVILCINGDIKTADYFVGLFFLFLVVFCFLVLYRIKTQLSEPLADADGARADGSGYRLIDDLWGTSQRVVGRTDEDIDETLAATDCDGTDSERGVNLSSMRQYTVLV